MFVTTEIKNIECPHCKKSFNILLDFNSIGDTIHYRYIFCRMCRQGFYVEYKKDVYRTKKGIVS